MAADFAGRRTVRTGKSHVLVVSRPRQAQNCRARAPGLEFIVPVTLVSAVACMPGPLTTWQAGDYAAYKIVRVLGGRRIAGSVWLPREGRHPARISNAHRDTAVEWFVSRVASHLEARIACSPRVALVPYPDPGRVVGAPPSRSRMLAQALADAGRLRVLDVLRWRQPMPRCRALEVQTLADNLVTTGGLLVGEYVLVAECVWDGSGMQAAAAVLRRHGALVHLAISAGRAGTVEPDPFSTSVVALGDVVTAGL